MFHRKSCKIFSALTAVVLLSAGCALLFAAHLFFMRRTEPDHKDMASAFAPSGQEQAPQGESLNGYEGFLPILLQSDNGTALPQDLHLYLDGTGKGFFFLPSFVHTENLSLFFDETLYTVEIDDIPVRSSDSVSRFHIGKEYPLSVRSADGTEAASFLSSVTFMQSKDLPAVFIATATGSLHYMHASKEHREPGTFACVLPDGSLDSAGALSAVKCRGNSSYLETAKKSYQIAFEDSTDVLSMGHASKYILQANAFDSSYLRNEIVYAYCRDLEIPYAVDTAYADLYFNGEYAGNYLVCERVETGVNRVNIPSDGYLIEKMISDRVREEDCSFRVSGMNWFIVKDADNIPDAQRTDLSRYMNHVADLIRDCDSLEKYDALSQYIDIDSFADMYLVNAITNDIDSNIASTYYYLSGDGENRRLYAGPVWDYDNAFGRHARGYEIALSAYPSGYCEELFEIPYFEHIVREKLNEKYAPVMERYLQEDIPLLEARILPSVSMDICRWKTMGYHSGAHLGHEDSVAYLYDYIRKRLEHVSDRINHPNKYHHVRFVNHAGYADYRDSEVWIRDGEVISSDIMEQMKERFHTDGFHFAGGNAYTNTRPVFSDMNLYDNNDN